MWYLAGAVLLMPVWLLASSLAPAGGLTRSFYYRLHRDANPLALDLRTMTVAESRADGVDLDFLENYGDWLTRDYFVRWRGVWFSPRAERIRLHASADDGVVVRVDGVVLIERHPAVGTHSESRSIELAAGAHTLEIDYWQRDGDRQLSVQWAAAGDEPIPLGSGRLFPSDPGAPGYWLRAVAERPMLLLVVWAGSPAVLLGWWIRRRVGTLTAAEVGARLRAVTLPALLGPGQVLLFGPWTVHTTNRTEFLVPFWSLAPRWFGLLGLIGGVLAAVGLLLPPRAFRRYVAVLCAAGVLLWAQGNLLVGNYGLLDGGGLDLAVPAWGIPIEVGIWSAALALALVSRRRRQPRRAHGERVADGAAGGRTAPVPALAIRGPPDEQRRCGELAASPNRDLRALRRPQPHPHRARYIPLEPVRRDSRRRADGVRSGLVRVHLLSGPSRSLYGDEAQHAGDAHGDRLAQRHPDRRLRPSASHGLSRARPAGLWAPVARLRGAVPSRRAVPRDRVGYPLHHPHPVRQLP